MQHHRTGQTDTRKTRLAARQARVGIIANVTVALLPTQPPREIWTRWPKLRSSRRAGWQKNAGQGQQPQQEATLSSNVLKELRRDLRAQAVDIPLATYPNAGLPPDMPLPTPPLRMQPVTALALCVLAGALALIALSFVLN